MALDGNTKCQRILAGLNGERTVPRSRGYVDGLYGHNLDQ